MAVSSRSCTTCRRRKVRCDRLMPSCTNCTRAQIDCHFPERRRPAHTSDDTTNTGSYAQLLTRIRSLEDTVHGRVPPATQSRSQHASSGPSPSMSIEGNPFVDDTGQVDLRSGGSVYLTSSAWNNFLGDTTPLVRPCPPLQHDADESSSSSILGSTQMAAFLKVLRPSSAAATAYWHTFKRRVEPLLKILHVPTFEPEFLLCTQDMDHASPYFHCMLFAICYGASASVAAHECAQILGEERSVLITRYSLALRKVFGAVDLLATDDIRVLQALVIYLFCLPREETRRSDGALAGMTLCIAQSLGIHRDGAKLGLSPFQTEMRRRLWWQTRLLNLRASIENSADFVASLAAFDNTLPLNVNDDALSPQMLAASTASPGWTDMSFCLVRIEILGSFEQQMSRFTSNEYDLDQARLATAEWVAREESRVQEHYLQYCSDFHALSVFTRTAAQLMLNKFSLILHCRLRSKKQPGQEYVTHSEKLLLTALNNIERANKLNTEARFSEWTWFSRSYTQCHAAAYILSQLHDVHRGVSDSAWRNDLANQAWSALEIHMGHQLSDDGPRQPPALKPLADAFRRAQEARQLTNSNSNAPTSDTSSSMPAFDWGLPFANLQADLGLLGGIDSSM